MRNELLLLLGTKHNERKEEDECLRRKVVGVDSPVDFRETTAHETRKQGFVTFAEDEVKCSLDFVVVVVLEGLFDFLDNFFPKLRDSGVGILFLRV